MTTDNIRPFLDNWTGTGEISGSGDAEKMCMEAGDWMESEVMYVGSATMVIEQNRYLAGDDVMLKYRTGATVTDCTNATWLVYGMPFESLGYVQVRTESTL